MKIYMCPHCCEEPVMQVGSDGMKFVCNSCGLAVAVHGHLGEMVDEWNAKVLSIIDEE